MPGFGAGHGPARAVLRAVAICMAKQQEVLEHAMATCSPTRFTQEQLDRLFGEAVFVDGKLVGYKRPMPPLTTMATPGSSSSNPPSPYGYYPTYTLPTQAKPPAKPGDKRPSLRCKKCQNIGKIVVAHADAFEVRIMCKLCGKEEVEK